VRCRDALFSRKNEICCDGKLLTKLKRKERGGGEEREREKLTVEEKSERELL